MSAFLLVHLVCFPLAIARARKAHECLFGRVSLTPLQRARCSGVGMHGVYLDASGHGDKLHDARWFMHFHGEQVLAMMREGLSLGTIAGAFRVRAQTLRIYCRLLGLDWPRKRGCKQQDQVQPRLYA